jgi:hypothetical protein
MSSRSKMYVVAVILFAFAMPTPTWGQGTVAREIVEGLSRALSKPQIIAPAAREVGKRSSTEDRLDQKKETKISLPRPSNCVPTLEKGNDCLFPPGSKTGLGVRDPAKELNALDNRNRPSTEPQVDFVDSPKPSPKRDTTEAWIEDIADGEALLSPGKLDAGSSDQTSFRSTTQPTTPEISRQLPIGWDGRVTNMGPNRPPL